MKLQALAACFSLIDKPVLRHAVSIEAGYIQCLPIFVIPLFEMVCIQALSTPNSPNYTSTLLPFRKRQNAFKTLQNHGSFLFLSRLGETGQTV